jgi:VWFA-related protein
MSCPVRFQSSVKIAVFFVFTLLFTSIVQGQAPAERTASPTPAAQNNSSTIVKNVDEVSLDVTVHNKKNKAVLDLKPGDIAVTDNDSRVEISDLRLISGATVATDHLITFLFDEMDPSAATNARSIAQKTLKMIPDRGFRVAVLSVNGRLRLFQEFTSDRRAITKAINVVTGENETEYKDATAATEKRLISEAQSGVDQSGGQLSAQERKMQETLLASVTESGRIIHNQDSQPSLAALSAISRMQSTISGRKVVVYFTPGLQVDVNTGDMVRSIIAAANRAGVSIYTINTSGIDPREFDSLTATVAIGNMMTSSNLNPAPALTGPPAAGVGNVQAAWIQPTVSAQLTKFESEGMAGYKEPLAAVSGSTGGIYVGANGNFRKPVRQMIADLSTYYELSYVPHIQQYDRQFHRVIVKSERPGLKIRTGAGYFAVAPNEESGTLAFEAPLLKVLGDSQLPSDLRVRSRILQLGRIADANTSSLVVEVPLSELESRDDPNTNLISWHASIVSQIRNKAGMVVEHFSEDIPQRRSLDSKDSARSESATMQRHFVLPPGEYVLETAALDRFSGKIGAERENFEVPNPAPGPFLSDVAMVDRIDPFPEEVDIFEPLRYERNKVVPSLSGRLLPGAKDISFFFLVHPDASVTEPPMLEMQVLRNGQLLGEMPLQMGKQTGEAFPYLASLRAGSLRAGNYEVNVILTQNGKVEQRGTNFRIEGPEVASNVATVKTDTSKPDAELQAVADSSLAAPEVESGKREPLVITALSPDSVSRPSPAEVEAIIAGARQHAVNYSTKLPNFLCVEVTNRSVDSSGNGRWRRKDSFAELLRYRESQETRVTLEVNGERSSVPRAELGDWPISLGEFGDVLNSVFHQGAKAEFQWKETDALNNGKVQVFEYRVARDNASITLSDSNGKIYAGFHGLAYIDNATYGIRRITMEADDLPHDFSIHAASIAVDYDYVAIGPHEYLMPVRGTISLKRGRHEADLNQIVFQGYKRYAAQTKITAMP